MFINEYGGRDDPTIILLALMMVAGSDLYRLMKPYLEGSYHIIAPDQGGHGKAGASRSADDEYKDLKDFLQETGCTDIKLVYGASLGVAVEERRLSYHKPKRNRENDGGHRLFRHGLPAGQGFHLYGYRKKINR